MNSPDYIRSPVNRFRCHKSSAKHRDIAFELTFAQWWKLWGPFWHLRGKRADQYCMARNGDAGPYAVNNVTIKKVSDNRLEQTQACGSRVGGAKLIEEDIPRVRDLLRNGVSQRNIAKWFGVGQPSIKDINIGKTWRIF